MLLQYGYWVALVAGSGERQPPSSCPVLGLNDENKNIYKCVWKMIMHSIQIGFKMIMLEITDS